MAAFMASVAESDVVVAGSRTITIAKEETHEATEAPVTLTLRKPRSSRGVQWAEGTVDNEGMGKKKSKCCCIYEKPRTFDESSSDSDDECEHCRGHVEKKKTKRIKHSDDRADSPEAQNHDPVHSPKPDI
ncbi:hypothetical protein RvY_02979 [Ramazzottius varieornatus]|uniref:E3 ubiquitin-protein ligase PPP1R11 n=1 Tax=Ramazzottius varieornatus TaxID=947166 RepID=A0A1D1UWP8_RAMVA|nr:hypothetical protein RvY_02979 [Ramazzottius varieornatus]